MGRVVLNHLETPVRQPHTTCTASLSAKHSGVVCLCSKLRPRGPCRIEPHVRRCGRCPPGSGVMFDLFLCFTKKGRLPRPTATASVSNRSVSTWPIAEWAGWRPQSPTMIQWVCRPLARADSPLPGRQFSGVHCSGEAARALCTHGFRQRHVISGRVPVFPSGASAVAPTPLSSTATPPPPCLPTLHPAAH